MLRHLFSFLAIICLITPIDADAARQYKVAKGDNLYRIGLKFGISYKEIMAANGMNKTVIYPNQVLIIPDQNASRPIQVASNTRSVPQSLPPQVAPPRPPSPTYYPPSRTAKPIEQQPYASARRAPSNSSTHREDPLGIGYNPSTSPYKNSPPPSTRPPQPIAHAKPVPSRPTQHHAPHSIPRVREVPAVANRPGWNSPEPRTYKKLDPIQYPTPSFKNPTTPSCVPQMGSGSSNHNNSQQVYIVQSGDSIWGISRKYAVSPITLRRVNNIMFSRIRPGMRLTIPK